MKSKFMPYTPTRNVSGRKNTENTVRIRITSPVRWAADACILLQNATVDWERLFRLAVANQVVMAVNHSLRYLRESLDAPSPDERLNGQIGLFHLRASR